MINVYALVDGSKLVYVGEFESITELINKGNIYDKEYKTIHYFLDTDIDESVIKNHPVYKARLSSNPRRFKGVEGKIGVSFVNEYTYVYITNKNQYIEYHDGTIEQTPNMYTLKSIQKYLDEGCWQEIPF